MGNSASRKEIDGNDSAAPDENSQTQQEKAATHLGSRYCIPFVSSPPDDSTTHDHEEDEDDDFAFGQNEEEETEETTPSPSPNKKRGLEHPYAFPFLASPNSSSNGSGNEDDARANHDSPVRKKESIVNILFPLCSPPSERDEEDDDDDESANVGMMVADDEDDQETDESENKTGFGEDQPVATITTASNSSTITQGTTNQSGLEEDNGSVTTAASRDSKSKDDQMVARPKSSFTAPGFAFQSKDQSNQSPNSASQRKKESEDEDPMQTHTEKLTAISEGKAERGTLEVPQRLTIVTNTTTEKKKSSGGQDSSACQDIRCNYEHGKTSVIEKRSQVMVSSKKTNILHPHSRNHFEAKSASNKDERHQGMNPAVAASKRSVALRGNASPPAMKRKLKSASGQPKNKKRTITFDCSDDEDDEAFPGPDYSDDDVTVGRDDDDEDAIAAALPDSESSKRKPFDNTIQTGSRYTSLLQEYPEAREIALKLENPHIFTRSAPVPRRRRSSAGP